MAESRIPESRRRANAFHLFETRHLRASPEEVLDFLVTKVPRFYRLLSPGHERFEVEGGGPLRPGARIDCRETTGDQEVHHVYEVRALTPSHLHLASHPSRSFVHLPDRTIEGTSETDVYYDLAPEDGGTRLAMTIVIALEGLGSKLLASTLGRTGQRWGRHQRGELDRLVALVEASSRASGPLMAFV